MLARTFRSIVTAALLALGAAALLPSSGATAAAASSPSAKCSRRNGRIAAVGYPGRIRLEIFRPNGRTYSVYSTNPETDFGRFSVSCDGRWAAFSESNGEPERHLVVVNLRTGAATAIDTGRVHVGEASFLSDGRITFGGNPGPLEGSEGDYVVDRDGSHLRRLFPGRMLAASRDGRWFVSSPTGSLHSLTLLDARGRTIRKLTGAPALDGSEYLYPSFSPNGRWVAYEEDIFTRPPHYHHHYVLFLVRRDGTHRRRIDLGAESASEPSFSPDGRWLLFTRTAGIGPGGWVTALRLDGSGVTRRVGLSSGYQYPAWLPR